MLYSVLCALCVNPRFAHRTHARTLHAVAQAWLGSCACVGEPTEHAGGPEPFLAPVWCMCDTWARGMTGHALKASHRTPL